MAVERMDNVSIVVSDLDAAVAFFEAIGLAAGQRATVSGTWVDDVLGLDGVESQIVVLETPDGAGRIELAHYVTPPAEPVPAPAPNTLGLTRVMFAVDDIDATLERLAPLGGTPLRTVARYENAYRLCYLRGPEGIIVALAQEL
ncbi:VOC family protein [Demequina sp.]|uniref:VOC family protein n=1 Tax=Demequina sp. TaxID=2050685 RepID=UPI003D0BBA21